jgi:hypothetical protein
MAGPDMGFSVTGLRAAALGHHHTAELARSLAVGVDGIVIVASDVGAVPAVAGFVAAAQAARNAQSAGARAEAERRADLSARTRGTADLGERLNLDTEAIARAGAPVAVGDGAEILRQMQPPPR